MHVLIINAGSSSIKYQLIDTRDEQALAKGQVERIGIPGTSLVQKARGKTLTVEKDISDHVGAIQAVLAALTDPEYGAVRGMDEIGAVGHRVVHGGEKFSASVRIDEAVMAAIRENVPLAPLHNPANIMGIEACQAVMPGTPMVAVFDTAFHQTMPPQAYLYALPYDCYTRLKVRRYGFHGTSHRYVAALAPGYLGRPAGAVKLVICHLGNGGSLSAVKNGQCVDTSMGLTPLEGLMMGTRSGDIDPAIVQYLMDRDGLTIAQVMDLLNKKSGLLGLSGKTSDMRDITAAAHSGDESARRALQVFDYRVRKYIGAYAAAMGGLDAIVFTAGIGENDAAARARIADGLQFLGAVIDPVKNVPGAVGDISTADSAVKILVVPTNEELAIARDTREIIEKA
ncbi:MAG: acetate kinase [Oscillospiraceae bacterium]|jgi:acetate kinase|nr:acetate kinase [Oscillospiraceae bacterium]